MPPGPHEVVTDGAALAWTVDGPARLGLVVTREDAVSGSLTELCGPEAACATFDIVVAP